MTNHVEKTEKVSDSKRKEAEIIHLPHAHKPEPGQTPLTMCGKDWSGLRVWGEDDLVLQEHNTCKTCLAKLSELDRGLHHGRYEVADGKSDICGRCKGPFLPEINGCRTRGLCLNCMVVIDRAKVSPIKTSERHGNMELNIYVAYCTTCGELDRKHNAASVSNVAILHLKNIEGVGHKVIVGVEYTVPGDESIETSRRAFQWKREPGCWASGSRGKYIGNFIQQAAKNNGWGGQLSRHIGMAYCDDQYGESTQAAEDYLNKLLEKHGPTNHFFGFAPNGDWGLWANKPGPPVRGNDSEANGGHSGYKILFDGGELKAGWIICRMCGQVYHAARGQKEKLYNPEPFNCSICGVPVGLPVREGAKISSSSTPAVQPQDAKTEASSGEPQGVQASQATPELVIGAYCIKILEASTDKDGQYIPVIIIENKPGYWPLGGKGAGAAPWTWGKDREIADTIAREYNDNMGVDEERAQEIMDSSVVASMRGGI